LSDAWQAPPAAPRASENEVHLWLAALDRKVPGPEALPAEERQRGAAFTRPGPAQRWIAARWALREVLGAYLDEEPAAVRLAVASGGKPLLSGAESALSFNLSHSGDNCLVAVVAGADVGVDLQRIVPRRDEVALARRALSTESAAAVAAAPAAERAAIFCREWTRHEARLKCLGGGLASPPPTVDRVAVRSVAAPAGYAAAVAVGQSTVPPLQRYRLP
jgi:4'-phosphopantetheinyl transferase